MKQGTIGLVAGVLSLWSVAVLAADPVQPQEQPQMQRQDRERIFGSQLMSPEERNEFRAKMRNLKTREEREAFRAEHHKQMVERAREKGMTLPEEPPAMGGGMGPGGGKGPGEGRR